MAVPTPVYQLFVGVDIAATTATVAGKAPDGPVTRAITIAQTAAGYASLPATLLASGHTASTILVVLEATGTSWITLATTLSSRPTVFCSLSSDVFATR